MFKQNARFLAAGLMLLGLAGAAGATVFVIRGSVVANGGQSSPPGNDGPHRLYATVGQPPVGLGNTPTRIVCSGFWCFGGSRVVSVDPEGSAQPAEFSLGPATPTPTRAEAHFRLVMPKTGEIRLDVFDVAGRRVGDSVSRVVTAGEQELTWKAPTAQAGIYFFSLAVDGVTKARRTIVLVR